MNNIFNYKEIISQYNLTFDKMPKGVGDCPFFGNGTIGTLLNSDGDNFRLELGRTDVYDHRNEETDGWIAYSKPRLMIGNFYFYGFKPIDFSGELEIYDANFKGKITTELGAIEIEHYVHAEKMLIITKIHTVGKEQLPKIKFVPHEAKTTRPGLLYNESDKESYFKRYGNAYEQTLQYYKENPQPKLSVVDGINVSEQDFLAGGSYCVAFYQKNLSENDAIVYITIENSYPEKNVVDKAIKHIKEVIDNTHEMYYNMLEQHTNWWHDYYKISGITIEDKVVERFYWLQIYKYACITRSNGALIDTAGIWMQPTPWAYVTNDLNTQMAYYSLYTAGRFELAESLLKALENNQQNLIDNVRPKEWQSDSAYLALASDLNFNGVRDGDKRYYYYTGNLMWLLHDCWLHYTHTLDENILTRVVEPIMKRALCFYFHLLKEDENGVLHLPTSGSPEFHWSADCSFDLALLKWGCKTYIEIGNILNMNNDTVEKCKDVSHRLTDYCKNSYGIRIGANADMDAMHRHFSHLLCIYPLQLMTGKDEQERELMERSIDHWMSFPGQTCGYPILAASSMQSILENGKRAYEYMKYFFSMEKVKYNTMYIEQGPCIETPCMLVGAVHLMMLQKIDDIIKIFPAIPTESNGLKNASFNSLTTDGGYIVSAEIVEGKVTFFNIKAKKSDKVTVKVDMQDFTSNVKYKIVDGNIEFKLEKGESAIFVAR